MKDPFVQACGVGKFTAVQFTCCPKKHDKIKKKGNKHDKNKKLYKKTHKKNGSKKAKSHKTSGRVYNCVQISVFFNFSY